MYQTSLKTFNLIYLYICYKGGEEVWDSISSSKAGNESQTAPLFWTHFLSSKLLKTSVGKRETEGRGWWKGMFEGPEPKDPFERS